MSFTKMLCSAAAALTLMVFAGTASATTLEVGGVAKNESVTIKSSLAPGTSTLLTATGGGFLNTCTAAGIQGHTEGSFTGTTVGGPITGMAWTACVEGDPTPNFTGTFAVERIGTTTNGTLRSNSTKVTWPSFFGNLTCTTSNTGIGTLTGVASGNATMDINAVLSCTIVSTAIWTATYTVTSPTGLGVGG